MIFLKFWSVKSSWTSCFETRTCLFWTGVNPGRLSTNRFQKPFLWNTPLKLSQTWTTQIKNFNIPLAVCKIILNIYEIPCIHLWQVLWFYQCASKFVRTCISIKRMIFEQTNRCLKMQNFLCIKGRTEFLWGILMQAQHKERKTLGIKMVNS